MVAPLRPGSQTKARVTVVEGNNVKIRTDKLVTEEPLEIRLVMAGVRQTVTVTMRTPGADFELAAGLLHAEGVVRDRDEIDRLEYCVDDDLDPTQRYNIVTAHLRPRPIAISPRLGGRCFRAAPAASAAKRPSIRSNRASACCRARDFSIDAADHRSSFPIGCANGKASSLKPAGCTPPPCSTGPETWSRCARTSGGTTRSTS